MMPGSISGYAGNILYLSLDPISAARSRTQAQQAQSYNATDPTVQEAANDPTLLKAAPSTQTQADFLRYEADRNEGGPLFSANGIQRGDNAQNTQNAQNASDPLSELLKSQYAVGNAARNVKNSQPEEAGEGEDKKNVGEALYDKIQEQSQVCETCRRRKYRDISNEADVSFKYPQSVAPSAAAGAVRAHENMHVANAYQKAERDGGKVLYAGVTLHGSICPECGKPFISGGTTTTVIAQERSDAYSAFKPENSQPTSTGALDMAM